MSAPPLDYRNPLHAARRGQIEVLLRTRDTSLWLKLAGMLTVGIAASFVGPALVAAAVATAERRWGAHWHLGWWSLLAIAAVVLVPLLFWLERRTRGNFFLDTARDWGLADRPSSYGEWEMQSTAATWAAYTEIALFGPRMTLGAIDRWRLRRYLGAFDLSRATLIVEDLLEAGQGVHPRELLRPGESLDDLRPTVLFLILHDVAQMAKRHDRVWLLSDARRALDARPPARLS